MATQNAAIPFQALLLKPREPGGENPWAFVILPLDVSACLPRRGRTSVDVRLKDQHFQVLLEPDGNKSHWLKIGQSQLDACGLEIGDSAELVITPVEQEPEPSVPEDLNNALQNNSAAQSTWQATTTIARIDWIHWITSAKQSKTRAKRVSDACDMLSSGKRRVCCFDPSGFYSKAFSAPPVAE